MGYNEKQKRKTIRKSILMKTKMQEIRRLDSGEHPSQISTALSLATSTMRTILKKKKICHQLLCQALELKLSMD